jgi:hypothetical protein
MNTTVVWQAYRMNSDLPKHDSKLIIDNFQTPFAFINSTFSMPLAATPFF